MEASDASNLGSEREALVPLCVPTPTPMPTTAPAPPPVAVSTPPPVPAAALAEDATASEEERPRRLPRDRRLLVVLEVPRVLGESPSAGAELR